MLLRLQKYDYYIKYQPGKDMCLPDSLSRLPKSTDDPEIDLNMQVCFVQFSTPKLRQLKYETETDEELTTLKSSITRGFPDTQRNMPKCIRRYWAFRDLLSVEDGLILKGQQVVVPQSLQREYLKKIHEGHQGITRCQQRARSSVYWPGINEDIENVVKQCLRCQTYQASQPKEPMHAIVTELPKIPWHTLGTDMFSLDGKDYLVMADYYSKFIVFEQMSTTTSNAVTRICKKYLALFGIPNTIISDNGPQFIGNEYQRMVNELGIVHITSSPHYARSHGFVESAVKIVQQFFKKSPNSAEISLLLHHNTPIGPGLRSPAELMFNRKLANNLPIHTSGHDDENHREKEASLQQKTEERYNIQSKELPQLRCEQLIFYQDVAKRTWCPGKVIGCGPEPRSYSIECQLTGRKLRRNRVLLRPRQVAFNQPSTIDQNHENSDLTYTWPKNQTPVSHPEINSSAAVMLIVLLTM